MRRRERVHGETGTSLVLEVAADMSSHQSVVSVKRIRKKIGFRVSQT